MCKVLIYILQPDIWLTLQKCAVLASQATLKRGRTPIFLRVNAKSFMQQVNEGSACLHVNHI